MALFECPTNSHCAALLRQGFAARLRSETANIYLSQHADCVTLTNERQRASIFFFCSGDGPLTAILARPPDEGDPKFLSMTEKVTLTDNPTLLKLTLSSVSQELFSISRVAPTEYLSLRHVSVGSSVNSRPKVTKWELFHLEVIPGTIGKGFVQGPFNLDFMKLSQSISHAILELGVRFRLRSIHDRVLRTAQGVVRQDGPRTPIASTHDNEFLMTAFRLSSDDPDAICADYALKDIASGKFLALLSSGAKLVKEETTVCVRASPNGWGTISVGTKNQDSLEWLMAGPRGRLEMRRQPGSWETFKLEFVRQSYDAALRELPVPGIYKVAETATRTSLRQQVEARVAQARRKSVQPAGKSNDKNAFDHSRALGGLGDPPLKDRKKAQPNERKKPTAASNETGVPAGASSKAGPVTGVKTAVSAKGLPRNKANRKASKKNRKKQKQNAAAKATASTKVPGQASPSNFKSTANAERKNKTLSEEEGSKEKADLNSDGASSSARKADSSLGPPCAACGRPLVGTYTTALGKSFHAGCFCCGRCRRPMTVGVGQFRERGGIPYCNSCYATHLASRCARCSQPIMDTVITAMEKKWHKSCLTCTICRLPLTQTFWLYADKPNEPRCSRCVTGDENYTSSGGSRKMLNLPTFGRSTNTPSLPLTGPTQGSGIVGGSSKGGRARLVAPVLPPTTRR